ncbi:hypothetical protein CCR91_21325 [Thiorhodovibrio winogradskyi]|nr:hypothetical protein [Thiorhodovibrio winogradskyi]
MDGCHVDLLAVSAQLRQARTIIIDGRHPHDRPAQRATITQPASNQSVAFQRWFRNAFVISSPPVPTSPRCLSYA